MKPEERIGETVGIYTIIGIDRKTKGGNRIYVCRCNICNRVFVKQYGDIKKPSSCTHISQSGKDKTFGLKWKNDRIRRIFSGMLRRCYHDNCKEYRWYGEKGIKVCDEWTENPTLFEQWSLENGYEDGLTIDRIDCNKDYCPENCRWISSEDNAKYKSTTRSIEVNGECHTGREWSTIIGYNINLINKYIRLYGIDDTKEFINRIMNNPELASKKDHDESLFDLYMS